MNLVAEHHDSELGCTGQSRCYILHVVLTTIDNGKANVTCVCDRFSVAPGHTLKFVKLPALSSFSFSISSTCRGIDPTS